MAGACGPLSFILDASPGTVWAAIAALSSLGTLIVAAITLFAIRDDSRARTRPMMTAAIRPMVLGSAAELIVTNSGASVARAVHVEFDPALPVLTGKDAEGMLVPFLQRRYAKPISTFTPGMTMRNIYQHSTGEPEPVPDNIRVTFRYRDDRNRPYSDYYDLSVELLKDETMAEPSGTSDNQLKRRVAKALEAIARGVGRS